MEQDAIIRMMKAYFAELNGPEQLEDFENLRASDLIEDSVDAVSFVMHLEDKTGQDIRMAEIGPALTRMTFGQLAGELARLVNARG